jgi:hypothetical protein
MTASRVARFLGVTVTIVVLVVSGAYILIDLARWEWHRAVSSSIFFLAALVVLATSVVLRSIRRLENRLDRMEANSVPGTAPGTTQAVGRLMSPAGPGRHFEWMRRPPDRLGVFVPVLLGAGVVLSVVAYAVERLAGALCSSTLDPETAEELGTELRLGDGPVVEVAAHDEPAVRMTPGRRAAAAVVLVVALVGAVGAVQLLRTLTQTRPGEVASVGSTVMVVEVEQRRNIRAPEAVVEDLWGACRSLVPGTHRITSVERLDPSTVQLEIDVALGRTGRTRIVGCFEDHTLDLVRADVVTISPVADRDGVLEAAVRSPAAFSERPGHRPVTVRGDRESSAIMTV